MAVWLISDANPGHYNQSLAVSDVLEFAGYGSTSWIEVRQRLRGFLRPAANGILDLTRGPLPMVLERAITSLPGELPRHHPKIIVSSGSGTVYANILLSRRFDAPNVFIGNPPGMAARHFRAIMHTEPSWRPQNGLWLDLLPTRLSPARAQKDGPAFAASIGLAGQRLCAMLLGGNSQNNAFRIDEWQTLAEGMNWLAAAHGFKWLVTSSRRTGREAEDVLRATLDPAVVGDATWWGLQPRPVVVPYICASDFVFCTQESVTMLSEGITSGKCVYAVHPDDHPDDNESLKATFVARHTASRRIRQVAIAQIAAVNFCDDRRSYFKPITHDVTKEMVDRLLLIIEGTREPASASSL